MIEACFACGGAIIEDIGDRYLTNSGICRCVAPQRMFPPMPHYSNVATPDLHIPRPTHLKNVDNSVDSVDNVVQMPSDVDPELRMEIAVAAMIAVETANFENAHQSAITVEDVADRAVRLADALLARLRL